MRLGDALACTTLGLTTNGHPEETDQDGRSACSDRGGGRFLDGGRDADGDGDGVFGTCSGGVLH